MIVFNFSSAFIQAQKMKGDGNFLNYDARIVDIELSQMGVVGTEIDGGIATMSSGEIELIPAVKIAVERKDNEGTVVGVRFLFEGEGRSYSYDILEGPNDAGIVTIYEVSSSELAIEDFSSIESVQVMLLYGEDLPTRVLDDCELLGEVV